MRTTAQRTYAARVAQLSDEVRELFAGANFAHVATSLPDGSPHSVPVWIDMQGDRIAFFTQPTSRKARNLDRDPRLAISILEFRNPYRMAQVRGRVAERLEGDAALEVIDRISQKFTGRDFPMRSGVAFLVEPERENSMSLPFEHRPPA
jgi:PPOX class probable F420-dependent enzyme